VTWLLVEDDPDIRNVVAVMMQLWGEKSLALSDGNAAWTWLDNVAAGTYKGELPELALMDIRMPGHTGDQIAARIRETGPIKNIPIILMTAFTLTEAEVQSMMARAGVDHMIKKPLPDMDVFKSTLYQVRDDKHKKTSALSESSTTTTAPLPSIPPTRPPTPFTPPAAMVAPLRPADTLPIRVAAAPSNGAPITQPIVKSKPSTPATASPVPPPALTLSAPPIPVPPTSAMPTTPPNAKSKPSGSIPATALPVPPPALAPTPAPTPSTSAPATPPIAKSRPSGSSLAPTPATSTPPASSTPTALGPDTKPIDPSTS